MDATLWTTPGGQPVVNMKRRTARVGDSQGLLVMGGYNTPASAYLNWVDPIVEQRPLIASAINTGSSFANDADLDRITETVDDIQASGWFPPGPIHLVGGSGGGLAVLKWAALNPTRVQSIVTVVAAVDIQYIYDNNVLSLGDEVSTAYGGRPADDDQPLGLASALRDIPIWFAYSTNDPVTPLASSEQFVNDSLAEPLNMGTVGHAWDADLFNGLTEAVYLWEHDPNAPDLPTGGLLPTPSLVPSELLFPSSGSVRRHPTHIDLDEPVTGIEGSHVSGVRLD